MQSATQWMREPEQERSRETLERIFDATETLLAERGVEATSLTEIVKRAGVSTGAFYARFSNKEHLFHALHQRFLADAKASTLEALGPQVLKQLTIDEIVRRIVEQTVALYRKHPGSVKAAFHLTRMHPTEEFIARTRAINEELVSSVKALLLARKAEIGHPNPEEAAGFLVTFLSSTLRETVVFASPLPRPDSDRALIDEMTYLACRYLGSVA